MEQSQQDYKVKLFQDQKEFYGWPESIQGNLAQQQGNKLNSDIPDGFIPISNFNPSKTSKNDLKQLNESQSPEKIKLSRKDEDYSYKVSDFSKGEMKNLEESKDFSKTLEKVSEKINQVYQLPKQNASSQQNIQIIETANENLKPKIQQNQTVFQSTTPPLQQNNQIKKQNDSNIQFQSQKSLQIQNNENQQEIKKQSDFITQNQYPTEVNNRNYDQNIVDWKGTLKYNDFIDSEQNSQRMDKNFGGKRQTQLLDWKYDNQLYNIRQYEEKQQYPQKMFEIQKNGEQIYNRFADSKYKLDDKQFVANLDQKFNYQKEEDLNYRSNHNDSLSYFKKNNNNDQKPLSNNEYKYLSYLQIEEQKIIPSNYDSKQLINTQKFDSNYSSNKFSDSKYLLKDHKIQQTQNIKVDPPFDAFQSKSSFKDQNFNINKDYQDYNENFRFADVHNFKSSNYEQNDDRKQLDDFKSYSSIKYNSSAYSNEYRSKINQQDNIQSNYQETFKQQEPSKQENFSFNEMYRAKEHQAQGIPLTIIDQNKSVSQEYVNEAYSDGSRYIGEKLNGMRNGFGKLFFLDSGRFEGQWYRDKMHGYGTLYYSSGKPAYEGQWVHDKFEGHGTLYNEVPSMLSYQFDGKDFEQIDKQKNDQFNFVSSCWIKYVGNFQDDSKHGFGTLYLMDGSKFEGLFQNDHIEGEGRFSKKSGEIIQGRWKFNKLIC